MAPGFGRLEPLDFGKKGEHERVARLVARQAAIQALRDTRTPFTRDDHIELAKEKAEDLLASLPNEQSRGGLFKKAMAKLSARVLRSKLYARIGVEVDALRKPNPAFTPLASEFTTTDWEDVNAHMRETYEGLSHRSPHYHAALLQTLERSMAEKFGLPESDRVAQLVYAIETANRLSHRAKAFNSHDEQWLDAVDAYRSHLLDAVGLHHAFAYLTFRRRILQNFAHRDES